MGISAIDRSTLRKGLVRFRPFRQQLWLVAALSLGQSSLSLPTLALIRQVLDVVLPTRSASSLWWIAAAMLGLRVASAALSLAIRRVVLRISKALTQQLRDDVSGHLLSRGHLFFASADLAELHTRVVQDTERIDNAVTTVVASILPAVLSIAILIAVMATLDGWLTVAALLATPVLWAFGRPTMRLAGMRLSAFRSAFEHVSSRTQFVLRFIELIRSRGTETAELAAQRDAHAELSRSGQRMGFGYSVHANVQRIVSGTAGVALLVAGGLAVIGQRLTLSEFILFYVAVGMLNGHVDTLSESLTELASGSAALKAVHDILSSGEPEPYGGAQPLPSGRRFAFDQVAFAYGDREILRDVSLEICPGDHVLIMGPNGAGKSTLGHLLTATLRPSRGRMTLDQIPYDALHLASLRRLFGIVPQHAQLFRGTVRENIMYGAQSSSPEALHDALRISQLEPVLARLPDGLDTLVGDQGTMLSGGERQRISIARALLAQPICLVLDEPTTHLDAASIGALMSHLAMWPQRPAIAIISHDPEVIRFSERAYQLDHGRLEPLDAAFAASR